MNGNNLQTIVENITNFVWKDLLFSVGKPVFSEQVLAACPGLCGQVPKSPQGQVKSRLFPVAQGQVEQLPCYFLFHRDMSSCCHGFSCFLRIGRV